MESIYQQDQQVQIHQFLGKLIIKTFDNQVKALISNTEERQQCLREQKSLLHTHNFTYHCSQHFQ